MVLAVVSLVLDVNPLRVLKVGMIVQPIESIPAKSKLLSSFTMVCFIVAVTVLMVGGLKVIEMNTSGFVEYSKTVVSNAGTLAKTLIATGHKLAIGRATNHLVLWVLVQTDRRSPREEGV